MAERVRRQPFDILDAIGCGPEPVPVPGAGASQPLVQKKLQLGAVAAWKRRPPTTPTTELPRPHTAEWERDLKNSFY